MGLAPELYANARGPCYTGRADIPAHPHKDSTNATAAGREASLP